jgi:hypothetical protein
MKRTKRREDSAPRYALVLEADDFEFLIETALLWKPPRVLVRRGYAQGEVWLDEADVSFITSRFHPPDEQRIRALVHEHFEDLIMSWHELKNDVRCGAPLSERHVLVD